MSKADSISAPQESRPTSRSWLRRSSVRIVAACLAMSCVLLVVNRDNPHVRLCLIRGADWFHSNFDLLSETHPVEFGPGNSQVRAKLGMEELQSLFSDYEVEISTNNTEFPKPAEVLFGHEWTAAKRFAEFDDSLPFDPDEAKSVFELSQNVRSLTEHGEAALPNVGTDPVEYLRFAKQRQPLTCRFFAVLMGATARTQGYTSRLLSLTKHGRAREHAVCEIYTPEFSKWILIDTDFNVAYQRNGEWLNASELHEAWQAFKRSLVDSGDTLDDFEDPAEEVHLRTGVDLVVLGPAAEKLRQSNMYNSSQTGINLEFFEYVLYSVRNDYLSAEYPSGHPIRSREYVLQDSQLTGPPPVAPEAYVIKDIDQFYWPVGRSQIAVEDCVQGTMPVAELRFATWTPNFDGFEVRLDRGEWFRTHDDRLRYELKSGENFVEIRSVNLSGLRGEVSQLGIRLTRKDNEQN